MGRDVERDGGTLDAKYFQGGDPATSTWLPLGRITSIRAGQDSTAGPHHPCNRLAAVMCVLGHSVGYTIMQQSRRAAEDGRGEGAGARPHGNHVDAGLCISADALKNRVRAALENRIKSSPLQHGQLRAGMAA